MLQRPLAAARSCHMLATLHVLHALTRGARRAQGEARTGLVTCGIEFYCWSGLAWRARRPRGSSCACLRRNSLIRVRTSSLDPRLPHLPIRHTRCTCPLPSDRSRHCAPVAPGDLLRATSASRREGARPSEQDWVKLNESTGMVVVARCVSSSRLRAVVEAWCEGRRSL